MSCQQPVDHKPTVYVSAWHSVLRCYDVAKMVKKRIVTWEDIAGSLSDPLTSLVSVAGDNQWYSYNVSILCASERRKKL